MPKTMNLSKPVATQEFLEQTSRFLNHVLTCPRCRVRSQKVAHVLVFSSTRYEAPASVRQKLLPGKTYVWPVEAYNEEGTMIESAQELFEMR
jgi:hypothetical protein